MSDIHTRLMESVQWLRRDGFETSAKNALDAADEITSLRAQLTAAHQTARLAGAMVVEKLKWAQAALDLARNGLKNRRGLVETDDIATCDVEIWNIMAAQKSIDAIVNTATPAALSELEAMVRDGDLQRAIARAAGTLPSQCDIHLITENGAAYVRWYDADGNEFNIDGGDKTLAEQVTEAIDAARSGGTAS